VVQSAWDLKVGELRLLVDGELILETERGTGWRLIDLTIKGDLRLEEIKRGKGLESEITWSWHQSNQGDGITMTDNKLWILGGKVRATKWWTYPMKV
jgi:hypothetical protein